MTMKITYVGNKNTLILIQVYHATFAFVSFLQEVLRNFACAISSAHVG